MSSHEEEEIFEVEKIVDHQIFDNLELWKVRWKGYGVEDDTWEPLDHLTGCLEKLEAFTKEMELEKSKKKDSKKKKKNQKSENKEEKKKAPQEKDGKCILPIFNLEKDTKKGKDTQKLNGEHQFQFNSPPELEITNFPNEPIDFAIIYGVDQSCINQCPPEVLSESIEPLWVKSIQRKDKSLFALIVFNKRNSNAEFWVPLEFAKKVCPQLVITYLLKMWEYIGNVEE